MVVNNSQSLVTALEYCAANNIGAFRILSQILPLYTHPEVGYELKDLPSYELILSNFAAAKQFAIDKNIRLSFHPDQFVVLSSPKEQVVVSSLKELEYHAVVANLVGADMINIHAGGVYGDKKSALERFVENFKRLKPLTQKLMTVENDDKSYTPSDLIKICEKLNILMVYDVHHHRCNLDNLSEKEATSVACDLATKVNKQPHFHISSPLEPWGKVCGLHRNHADFIDINDFPKIWKNLSVDYTVDIEAKAKELAVKKLYSQLSC